MNLDKLQKKYEGTGITAVGAMIALEDAKRPTHFQIMLDPVQVADWIEFQHYKAMKTINGIGIDKLQEMIKSFDRGN